MVEYEYLGKEFSLQLECNTDGRVSGGGNKLYY